MAIPLEKKGSERKASERFFSLPLFIIIVVAYVCSGGWR